jgi:hypothetical protein
MFATLTCGPGIVYDPAVDTMLQHPESTIGGVRVTNGSNRHGLCSVVLSRSY